MARKVKFALEMADGTKVRSNLEELREHFDIESIASYYLSGKLLEWLEDRYYDDEAAKIEELDKDSPNLNAQLCAIIGVDASKYDALDLEAVERLNEKKTILRQKTSDSTIIDNAMITALNQEDLADLLDLESPVIYLCGEKFNIPIRVEHKKYIGILSKPKIEIRATSMSDLEKRDILFDNVELPWDKSAPPNNSSNIVPNTTLSLDNQIIDEEFEMLKALYENIFGTVKYGLDTFRLDKWMFVDDTNTVNSNSDLFINSKSDNIELQKKISLKIVCNNKYRDNEIIHAHMNSNCSHGWMLTKDSFCIGGGDLEKVNIKYKDIEEVEFDSYSGCIDIETTNEDYNLDWCGHPIARAFGDKICEFLKGAATITSNS